MASRRNWCKSARPAGFPSGGCPQCQADWPDARIALHVLSGGSTRQMRNRINSIKDDHALVDGLTQIQLPALPERRVSSRLLKKLSEVAMRNEND